MTIPQKYIMSADLTNMSAPFANTSLVQLVPVGTWKGYKNHETGEKQTFTITPDHISQMAKNFNELGRDEVLDYEHQTLSGQQAPAAGWIKKVYDRGKEGLWGMVEWTAKAIEYLRNKEYKYLSPVFSLNSTDAETGKDIGATLQSAALTNDPFFSNLKPVVATNQNNADYFIGANTYPIQEEKSMKTFISKVCKFLGKAEDAPESELNDALDKHIAEHQKLKKATDDGEKETKKAKADLGEILVAMNLKPEATIEEAKAAIMVAKGSQTASTDAAQRLQALETQVADRDFETIIASNFQAGKILPTQKADSEYIKTQKDFFAKAGKVAFEQFWAKQPIIGPLQSTPNSAEQHAASEELTEAEQIVCKKMGVNPEDYKKQKKALLAK